MISRSFGPYTTTTYSRGIYALVKLTPNTVYSVNAEKEGYCLQSLGTDGGLIFQLIEDDGYHPASGGGDKHISELVVGTINNTGTGCYGYASYTDILQLCSQPDVIK